MFFFFSFDKFIYPNIYHTEFVHEIVIHNRDEINRIEKNYIIYYFTFIDIHSNIFVYGKNNVKIYQMMLMKL